MSKIYSGVRVIELHNHDASKSSGVRGDCFVTVDQLPLKSINEVEGWNTPYEWACKNSASTNLAESLLADYLETLAVPEELVILFRNDVISKLGFDKWQIEEWELIEWINATIEKIKPDFEIGEANYEDYEY